MVNHHAAWWCVAGGLVRASMKAPSTNHSLLVPYILCGLQNYAASLDLSVSSTCFSFASSCDHSFFFRGRAVLLSGRRIMVVRCCDVAWCEASTLSRMNMSPRFSLLPSPLLVVSLFFFCDHKEEKRTTGGKKRTSRLARLPNTKPRKRMFFPPKLIQVSRTVLHPSRHITHQVQDSSILPLNNWHR